MEQKTKQEQKHDQDKPLITKEMTVGEVVGKYPHLTDTLLKYGLHCVGCHASTWETLEQGTMGHGMPEEVLDAMVKELNEKALEKPAAKTGEGITLTDRAVQKTLEFAKAEGKEHAALRVQVIPGGCSGSSYDLAFDDNEPTEDDKVYAFGKLRVFVDEASLEHLQGTKIDFVETLQGSGFKIDNPSAKNSCGCGNSFS